MDGIEEEICGTMWRGDDGCLWLEEDAQRYEWNAADWMAEVERDQLWRTVLALCEVVASK